MATHVRTALALIPVLPLVKPFYFRKVKTLKPSAKAVPRPNT